MPANSNGLQKPNDANIKIWRYMKLEKFKYLLESECLYFARADMFEDPFEGSLTEPSHTGFLIDIDIPCTYEDGTKAMFSEVLSNIAESSRTRTYVNCWHMNEGESDAMWKLYGQEGKSIAIQSTYTRLANCLPNGVHLGVVRYIDYSKDQFPHASWLLPFYHKRKAYEHEKEVRAVVVNHSENRTSRKPKKPQGKVGIGIPIDPNKLIEAVFIAPGSTEAFRTQVEKIVKQSKKNFIVKPSNMDEKPIF